MPGDPGELPENACEDQVGLTFKRRALLCVTVGAHLLLFRLVTVNDNPRSERTREEARGVLFFVELAKPSESQPSTHLSSIRPTDDFPLESMAAHDNIITLAPEIEGTEARTDWDVEARRVARAVAGRMGEEKQLRSLDHRPAGMGPLPPKPSRHKLGDSQHFEGGVIIDWIKGGCYYSNQNAPIAAFGPALRLQTPTCTGAGGGDGDSLPSFEEWKKEQANR